MKKLLAIFSILLIIFIAIWTYKLKTPLTPNNPFKDGLTAVKPWWETMSAGSVPEADSGWTLDPEIPSNYIPVLGAKELYMVINEDGSILEYRHRTQQPDGSWGWETVNPDIPENYAPVEGLEGVYRVTGADGNAHYFRYHRNSDDTYYFIEVDENGNELKKDIAPVGEDGIPANYIRINGTNIYAVYNEYGVLLGYKERVLTSDGTYIWRDTTEPSTSSGSQSDYWNWGGIPELSSGSKGSAGDITVVVNDLGEERGYIETKTTTTTKQEGGYTIVYQTVVSYEYDLQGMLIKTTKDGPTEVNRFPTTAVNTDIIPKN